jgi:hypothetical protein
MVLLHSMSKSRCIPTDMLVISFGVEAAAILGIPIPPYVLVIGCFIFFLARGLSLLHHKIPWLLDFLNLLPYLH